MSKMPKSRGSDAKAGAKPMMTGMGKTSKPASYSPPKIKVDVKPQSSKRIGAK